MSDRKRGHAIAAGVALWAVVLATAGCGGSAAKMSKEECEKYPEKEITLTIGHPPGGLYDEYARVLAPLLKKRLGTNVVVKPVEGAGGRVAASQVYEADPDGYTIHLMEPNGLAALQVVEDVEYDLRKYTQLGIVNERPHTFAVSVKSDIKTFEDLVAAGKNRQLKFATAGFASPSFINGVIAAKKAGIKIRPVPHGGSAEAITSVVRGDTDFTVFPGDTVAEAADAGDLRALVQFGSKPLDLLGDTPTSEDVGLGDLAGVLVTNFVLVAPPDLPSCIATKLTDATRQTLNSKEFAAFGTKGRIVSPGSPQKQEELMQTMLSTYKRYADTYRQYLAG